MSRPVAVSLLILTTMLWGFAFVAQKSAMDSMDPLTFSGVRYAVAVVAILPFVVWEYRRRTQPVTRQEWRLIVLLGLFFFVGVYLQQVGLTTTTVTNAGFLTSLYVLFVPLIAIVAVRHLPHPIVWACMPMAVFGVFLLNGGHLDRFNLGDLLVLGCAVCWAVQLLLLGHLAKVTGLPVTVSVCCFAITAVLSTIGAFAFEVPTLSGLAAGWVEIAYSAILSTAVAFTLQAIAQQYVPPSNSAIILSAESLFAALGGAVVLGERLPLIGYFGAALIFAAIVLVETIPALSQRKAETAGA
jgi:drug/metabolite transporter (DMT)-like permease